MKAILQYRSLVHRDSSSVNTQPPHHFLTAITPIIPPRSVAVTSVVPGGVSDLVPGGGEGSLA
ncbi:hypothetical protein E2C01_012529 [Portunus trituberculatus]|uniref:Uncharacterized protein n=1 Tax=Portunus trituberculatus TaxID=210409 RepID=A0A5B7DE47_PORTR|nr:hypothetical protein [Portunus trituberculatus]